LITKYGQRAYRVRRDASKIRELATVDTPTNQGKLGALLVAQGRPRKALEPLRAATRGEPEVAEWHYRLGCALLQTRQYPEAVEALQKCVALDEEYAYGAAQLRLAEALTASKRASKAIDALAVFERNHGPSPESAYRRGLAYKQDGQRDAAKQAFDEVAQLAQQVARYQRTQAGMWTFKAKMASML